MIFRLVKVEFSTAEPCASAHSKRHFLFLNGYRKVHSCNNVRSVSVVMHCPPTIFIPSLIEIRHFDWWLKIYGKFGLMKTGVTFNHSSSIGRMLTVRPVSGNQSLASSNFNKSRWTFQYWKLKLNWFMVSKNGEENNSYHSLSYQRFWQINEAKGSFPIAFTISLVCIQLQTKETSPAGSNVIAASDNRDRVSQSQC